MKKDDYKIADTFLNLIKNQISDYKKEPLCNDLQKHLGLKDIGRVKLVLNELRDRGIVQITPSYKHDRKMSQEHDIIHLDSLAYEILDTGSFEKWKLRQTRSKLKKEGSYWIGIIGGIIGAIGGLFALFR